ncbi:MlaA family lipoprotein, partial [Vibrio sinaloensis]
MKSFTSQIWLALIASVLLAGCASAPNTTEESESTSYESHSSDPIEGFNRAMWSINYDYLDPYLVRPVSLAYV